MADEIVPEYQKEEFFLQVGDFKKANSVTKNLALARVLQTLIILMPGTYPNAPDMGVGIEQYLFEFLDGVTIQQLTQRLRDQIDTYIPNNDINGIEIQPIKGPDGKTNTLGMIFTLGNSEQVALAFDLAASRKTKVVSRVVLA
jgi:hypothetical protein